MLNIKSQKITPDILAESEKISFIISSQDVEEHTGDWDFFAVFSFAGTKSINTQVATNVVTDVFSHSLVLDGTEPVLQILEKSIKECKEALQKMQTDGVFNVTAAVFKGDFVYVSIYGKSRALYLDDTQIIHVDTEKEGNYAGAAQKIEDGKVMVLCTDAFFRKFPPKSLVSLTKPISAQDLDELSSAIIIKVSIGINKTTNGVQTAVKSPKTHTQFKRFLKPALIAATALLVLAGGFFLLKRTLLKPKDSTQNSVQQETSPKEGSGSAEIKENEDKGEVQGELTKQLDDANKVTRVSAEVFYDISITDAKTNPTELALGKTYIAVCDNSQGKIYVSTKEVTKFEELPQLFPGVKNLAFNGDTLIFTDNEGVKFYSLATKSVEKSYLMDANYTSLGAASEYSDFTYGLSGDKLVKFSKAANKLSGALWLQKAEFANGVGIAIDGSIYVLFSNGDLEKYTAGVKDDFSIVGFDKALQKPLKVIANADYKHIYVGDGAEGRIVALDDDGVLDFQIKPESGSEWDSLKSFDISLDEKTFYALSGTKVYEFNL